MIVISSLVACAKVGSRRGETLAMLSAQAIWMQMASAMQFRFMDVRFLRLRISTQKQMWTTAPAFQLQSWDASSILHAIAKAAKASVTAEGRRAMESAPMSGMPPETEVSGVECHR